MTDTNNNDTHTVRVVKLATCPFCQSTEIVVPDDKPDVLLECAVCTHPLVKMSQ